MRCPPVPLHVLDAEDGGGQPVSLVHEDSPPLRRMAVFDVLVNNADRKGGHVLAMTGGHRYGVDHGVCFHTDDKLRTVLWGWAREPLTPRTAPRCEPSAGPRTTSALGRRWPALLTGRRSRALDRGRDAAAVSRMPVPSGAWPSIPWPAF